MISIIRSIALLILISISVLACTNENALETENMESPVLMATQIDSSPVLSTAPVESELLPLPEFSDCGINQPPVLPDKWTATAMMQDFVLPFIMYSNMVYDKSVDAFSFSLLSRFGTDLDFLVTTDRKLYVIKQISERVKVCALVSNESIFTVPSQSWLDPQAVCVGEAPILDNNVQWWKTPKSPGANWIWYDTDSRLPFRSMYYEDVQNQEPAPIYEHFTFNYFPKFESVQQTKLPELLAFCKEAGVEERLPNWDLKNIEGLINAGTYPNATKGETFAKAQEWIPGVEQRESENDLPPPWPEKVQGSVFMTAVSFPPNPFPTRVFYDWSKKAQNTSLYYYPPPSSAEGDYVQVALLTDDTGYIRIEDQVGTVNMCEQALPGTQVPNWKSVDQCKCLAQLAPNTVLNPSNVPTKVLNCPTDAEAQQYFWTWYSDEGTPVVFMQTNSSPTAGTGLNLADYYHWLPDSVAPEGTFDLPAACDNKPKVDVPQACHNCHLPLNTE